MIGEPIGGVKQVRDVPVGCVVYSAESEGQTKNVVVVQGAWGHPEIVVNNEGFIDTFFVRKTDGAERSVTPVVVNKPYRVVPMKIGESFGLQMMANKGKLAALVEMPILNNEEAVCIARVAEEIGRHYNEPMDIELVYDRRAMREEGNILLVE